MGGCNVLYLLCIVCDGLFSKMPKTLVNKAFSNWHQINDKQERHEGDEYHKSAKKAAQGVTSRFEKPRKHDS